MFSQSWNGTLFSPLVCPDISVASDASGSWGCGAITGTKWFQLQWPTVCLHKSIAVKELMPIILAVMVWGRSWFGCHVHCHCDNEAVVTILGSRYALNPDLMHLLRWLFFLEAYYKLHISASHIRGVDNILADNLSRNNLSSFLLQAPIMSRSPAPFH